MSVLVTDDRLPMANARQVFTQENENCTGGLYSRGIAVFYHPVIKTP